MPIRPSPVFLPFSALYGAVVGARNALYDAGILRAYCSSLPVLCVGNVTAGGSGKTPFAHFLCRGLLERGERPVILSRGHGGVEEGPKLVSGSDDARAVGDEAILHRESLPDCPIVIARRRADGARFIEREKLGTVIVLDDGFQHRALLRTGNILLLDCSSEDAIARWERGHLLPAGYLREPLRSALRRADVVVFASKGVGASAPRISFPEERCFQFSLRPVGLRDAVTNVPQELSWLRGNELTAAAAIGDPEQFFRMLVELGAKLVRTKGFPDHHAYSSNDWASLGEGPVICTAKDAVKLRGFARPGRLFVLELEGGFRDEEEKARFFDLVA